VQISPEPHAVPAATNGCVQLPVPSHTSLVHALPSLVHVAPEPWKPLAGQLALLPVQYSATSHTPLEVRHWVAPEANPSAGQLLLAPVPHSATSHVPAEPRHCVVEGCLVSPGHTAELPVQYSAASHTPAEARHIVVAGLKLQLVIDWLGSHIWQAAFGLAA